MKDKSTSRTRPVNPFSTGAGGAIFEFRVAVCYLVDLLCGRQPRGLAQGASLHAIGLQQRNRGNPVDDIVAHALWDRAEVTLSIQAKHSLIVSDNEIFEQVVGDLWSRAVATGIENHRELLGIAVSDATFSRIRLQEVRDVCHWAEHAGDRDGFFAQVDALKARGEIVELVRTVISRAADSPPSDAHLWRFFARLRLLAFDVDIPEGRDAGGAHPSPRRREVRRRCTHSTPRTPLRVPAA